MDLIDSKRDFLKVQIVIGLFVLIVGTLLDQFDVIKISLQFLFVGFLFGLGNVWILGMVSEVILRGARSSTSLSLILVSKLLFFLLIILLVSEAEPVKLYSALAGFFIFLPSSLVYAIRLRSEEESE